MFLQKSRIFQKNEACTKSIFSSSLKLFSQQAQNITSKISIDQKLLYPFSQSQTCKALKNIQEASAGISKFGSGKTFLLDRLGTTDYSETFRAYDLDRKSFVVQKNIDLDSLASWNQANLILRQQQLSPFLAQTLSIDYDEKKRNLKVTSELQNTVLKDYSLFMKDYQRHWLHQRMKVFTMQIIQQLNTLKELGIELDGKSIDTRKIFIEKTSQVLKLYDFSDFVVKEGKCETDKKEFLEIAKQTLISLGPESVKKNDISLVFDEIEAEMHNIERETGFNQEDFDKISASYDQFIFDKLLRVLKEKAYSNLNGADLMSDLKIVYKKHAEIYKTKGDFKSALECYEKIMEIEENSGQAKEGIKSQSTTADMPKESSPAIDKYIPTSLSGKLAVMMMKVTFFLSAFIIAFMFFGLITAICFYGYFNLFDVVVNDSKQEEKEEKN